MLRVCACRPSLRRFKGGRLNSTLAEMPGPERSPRKVTDSSFIQERDFSDYFNGSLIVDNLNNDKPHVLILEDHGSHVILEVFKLFLCKTTSIFSSCRRTPPACPSPWASVHSTSSRSILPQSSRPSPGTMAARFPLRVTTSDWNPKFGHTLSRRKISWRRSRVPSFLPSL